MKKMFILIVAFVLSACGVAAPTQAPLAEPAVIVATVLVPVIVTQEAPAVPTDTPIPPTLEAPTVVPTETLPPVTEVAPTDSSLTGGGGDVFSELTRSTNQFSLRCASMDKVTFSLKATNAYTYNVEIYYRIQDKVSNLYTSGWNNGGKMKTENRVDFTRDFYGYDVHSNLRVPNGWFEYQFVAVNQFGDVLGRSDIFKQQVTWTIDCPK